MIDCIEAWRQRHEGRAIIVGKSVVAVALIAGCSWVPDAVNPVEWYKGIAGTLSDDDQPEIASPRRPDGSFPTVNPRSDSDRKEPGRGLVADRDNSKYAAPVKREPAPTKQLARKSPPPQATQTAQGVPSLERPMAAARDDGPQAPPQVAMAGPPARPDIPEAVPTRRTVLGDHYQRRLNESAAATNKNDPFATVPPPRPESSYNQPVHTYAVPAVAPVSYAAGYGNTMPAQAGYAANGAPELIPPRGAKTARGARGAVIPAGPAASFQVAAVQFAADGDLTAADRAALKEVAQLQKRTGGVVRVLGQASPGAISFVGLAPEMVAAGRARTVARTLTSMGVPARKVLIASDPSASAGYDDSGARISIEY